MAIQIICDDCDHTAHVLNGSFETLPSGWVLNHHGDILCPTCANRKPVTTIRNELQAMEKIIELLEKILATIDPVAKQYNWFSEFERNRAKNE